MTATTRRLGAALAALTICLAAGGGEAATAARHPSQRTTFLLSSANGGFPNGPSRNAAVSHDQRIARYIAYESDASNIVAGDTNGKTDVFLVPRAQPYGQNGTPWKPAGTKLISRGKGGRAANGASYGPALDGDSHHVPHCVAFVSAASNLVRGDTNGKPDGFVYDVRSGRVKRVTVGSAGTQANGSTYGISISGDCERVAFTSDATNLALTKASKASWSTAKTTAAPSRTRQVYVHVLGGSGLDAPFKGLTFLASAANNGAAGNGDSQDAGIARSGKAVVFSSTATNLAKGDGSATSDVYRRTIFRRYEHVGGNGVQTLRGSVGLVSANASGSAGNGPSTHPAVTDDGRYVAFATEASDLLAGDSNGVSDIARADMRTGKPSQQWVSKSSIGGIANGASHDPVISDAGQFVLFDSDATNLRPSQAVKTDRNGVKDVFLWNGRTSNVSLESRDANNGYLSSPSQNPATSSHGNYVAFESGNAQLPGAGLSPQMPNLPSPQMPNLPTPQMPSLPSTHGPSVPSPQMPGLPSPHIPNLPTPSMPKPPGFGGARSSASSKRVARPAASASEQVYVRYLGPK